MSQELVSCLMPTYNRAPGLLHLVGEAVASFFRQDYPHKELIILNDTPGQLLEVQHFGRVPGYGALPVVRVINTAQRIATLGEKRDWLVQLALGQILMPWDDDDISLPHRISQAVRVLGQWADQAAYYNPQRHWYLDGAGLHSDHHHGYCHNCSAFTRMGWQMAGGYPPGSGWEDAEMDKRLKATCKVFNSPLEHPSQWSYIYRWGVSPTHCSSPRYDSAGKGSGDDTPYLAIGMRSVEPGVFSVEPGWQHNYVQMTRDHMRNADAIRQA